MYRVLNQLSNEKLVDIKKEKIVISSSKEKLISAKELELENPNNIMTPIYAYHKNKWISPAMELFIKLLKENFAQTEESVKLV